VGQLLELTAADGFVFGAYRAEPAGPPRGGLVVVQEIFGVNAHIRNVCDRFAAHGYMALAPSLFDRLERDFQSGYSPEEVEHARAFIPCIDWTATMLDMAACVAALAPAGKVGVVGYCLGGSIAYLSATRLDGIAAAVGYYGGMIAKQADETPKAPVQLHFGDRDPSIPVADVEIIARKRRDCEIHVYPAGHAFSNDDRTNYDAASAEMAMRRTLAWFGKHVG
jgi:carboxymethylenebutenolidase